MALSVGVSYSDFWKMTPGEITSVLSFANDREEARQKRELRGLAFAAYYSGGYSRETTKLPRTVREAFPELFGRMEDGQIKAEDWQESERAMAAWAARFEK